jgi:hypothetical protein
MIIQTLKDLVLPNGVTVQAGAVLNVPDTTGAALVEKGDARLRIPPGPTEKKADQADYLPGDPLPPQVPYVQVPTQPSPARSYEPGAYEDQDNFVRDMVTFTYPVPMSDWWWDQSTAPPPPPPVVPSGSASARVPVLTLTEIKLHCHIEPDQTTEDPLLLDYEMGARLNTENYLRYTIDETVGENIKLALLLLIAHWYRNREAVSTGRTMQGVEMPLGYKEILSSERDYPVYT